MVSSNLARTWKSSTCRACGLSINILNYLRSPGRWKGSIGLRRDLPLLSLIRSRCACGGDPPTICCTMLSPKLQSSIMSSITSSCIKKVLLIFMLFCGGMMVGVLMNRYGIFMESIVVDVNVNVKDVPPEFRNQSKYAIVERLRRDTLNHSQYVVPNIVHFIWFGEGREMQFLNYISIKSAKKIQKPDEIMLHCDYLPLGKWWDRLKKEVKVSIKHRLPPTQIHNQTLLHMYHKGDVAKLEILMEYGGIYLDYDVIVLHSMDPLRHFDMTMGKERPPKFIAGIIVARKNALFLKIFYESYRNNYRPLDWDYNCARVTYQLYRKRPDLIHVEPYRLTTPDWTQRHLLWKETIDWSQLYVVHVMQHLSWYKADPDNIKDLESTFGEVMRYIYYGSPKLIKS